MNLSGTLTLRTVGDVVAGARAILNDPAPVQSGAGYSGTRSQRTLGALITEARTLLNDTTNIGEGLRWSDSDLYLYLSGAVMQAWRFRPDLFVAGTPVPIPTYTPANANTLFPLDDAYYPAFIQYVVGQADMREDTFAADGKGATLLAGFVENLMKGPYRYSDTQLYGYVGEAVTEARRMRPDMFLNTLRAALPRYSPTTDAATPFPVDEGYFAAFVDYVVGRALLRDSAGDGKAIERGAAFIANFKTALGHA